MMSLVEGFERLSVNPELYKMLNNVEAENKLPLAPQGLRVYWNTLCQSNGWKLQKNYYYDHYRVIDQSCVIRASGSQSEMLSAMVSLA